MKKRLLLHMTLVPILASAYDAKIDGIYYDLNASEKTAMVTSEYYNSVDYSGSINIPSTITYEGDTYSVTSIGSCAFYKCKYLTSVTIPNSVTSIKSDAFYGCSGSP